MKRASSPAVLRVLTSPSERRRLIYAITVAGVLVLMALACEESGASIKARFPTPQPEAALTHEFISPILQAGAVACLVEGEPFQDRGFTCQVQVEGVGETECVRPLGSVVAGCDIPIDGRIWFCLDSEVSDVITCFDDEDAFECKVPPRGDVNCQPTGN